jgi:hypothetical protein
MTRRITALCVTLACCFALAACSSGSNDTGKAPGSGTSVSTGAQPDIPGDAKAFASTWVNTLNAATTSGNTKELKKLAAPTCTRCEDFVQSLTKIYGAGGHVDTAGWKLVHVIPVQGGTKEKPVFQLSVQVAPQTVVASKGAKAKKYQGGKQGLEMFLTPDSGHWVVEKINI